NGGNYIMLQNQSFETSFLQEELEATQTELFVLESVNAITEAEEAEQKEANGDKSGFAKKLKDFFIAIVKKVMDALKAFTNFFVEAFNKLMGRIKKIKEYAKSVQLQGGKFDEPVEVKVMDFGKVAGQVSAAKLHPENAEKFPEEVKAAEDALAEEKTLTANKPSDFMVLIKAAEDGSKAVKKQAGFVKDSANGVKQIGTTGVSLAAKVASDPKAAEAAKENKA